MDRFTSARKKLTLALLSLCGALALLGTATYAWYTLSTAPEVSGLEFGVSAAQALLVSKERDGTYQQQIELDKMSDILQLVPASTLDGLNWFVCRYEPNGSVRQDKSTTATGNYEKYLNNQYDYLRFPHGGNGKKPQTEAQGEGEGETEGGLSDFWNELNQRSLYAWQDIYLKTTEEKVKVHIANGVQDLEHKEKQDENYRYGTYVLGYSVETSKTKDAEGDETETETVTVRLMEGGAETCARVGLLVLEEYEKGGSVSGGYTDKGKFFILEPNADRRSAADKTDNAYNADVYVPNFNVKNDLGGLLGENASGESGSAWQRAAGWYLPTYPVTLRDGDAQRVERKFGNGENETPENKPSQPTKDERDDYIDLAADGTPGLNQDNLIVMTSSTWAKLHPQTQPTPDEGESSGENEENGGENVTPSGQAEEEESGAEGGAEPPTEPPTQPTATNDGKLVYTSNVVGTFGQFVQTGDLYNTDHQEATANRQFWAEKIQDSKTTTTASQELFTLTKDKPVKVRLYFWVEGQDIDCWNDISGSNFLVNLELSGEVVQTD